MIKKQVTDAFLNEFYFIADKIEIMDLLANNSLMDYDTINTLKLPNNNNNIVWHPGVYVFIGNSSVYRIGVSMKNSRYRVMQHLRDYTSNHKYAIWDINKYQDRSILLFNVKEPKNRHWLLSIEAFLEEQFSPLIRAKRIG